MSARTLGRKSRGRKLIYQLAGAANRLAKHA
jgi:hypothetical protein